MRIIGVSIPSGSIQPELGVIEGVDEARGNDLQLPDRQLVGLEPC